MAINKKGLISAAALLIVGVSLLCYSTWDRTAAPNGEVGPVSPITVGPTAVIQPKLGELIGKDDDATELFANLPEVEWDPGKTKEWFSVPAEERDVPLHRNLLALFLVAPVGERASLGGHISNLTPDGDYAPVAWIILNGGLDAVTLSPLLGDLHDRPASTKLNLFAEILAHPDHPAAKEAKRTLAFHLQEEYEVPSPRWGEEVSRYLASDEGMKLP